MAALRRTHQIGQIVPGKVTKLVPFGSFVRVEEGIEGLVHISELAERHVEIPEQVVQVNDDVMVKIIDIDLERRRISLSLKQANDTAAATDVEEFDPTLYGMTATYDEQGNYVYPEGFDRRPASGSRASRSSAPPGRSSTPRRTLAGRPTSSSRPRPSRPRSRRARPRRTPAATTRSTPRPRVAAARWPRTRPCRRFARSSPAAATDLPLAPDHRAHPHDTRARPPAGGRALVVRRDGGGLSGRGPAT